MEPKEAQQTDQPQAPANAPVEPIELSEREREILILVAGGASNKEVAQQLVISPNTVKVHLRNIFGKLGVSSRTEAALYAVRAGLVRVAVEPPPNADNDPPNGAPGEAYDDPPAGSQPAPLATSPIAAPAPSQPARIRPVVWVSGLVLLLLTISVIVIAPRLLPDPTPDPTVALTSPPVPTTPPRWQTRTAMPSARGRLAAVSYENHVYAIGGETAAGVTGTAERYDPASDAWTSLAPKPVPVADAGAAVVGGLIYVPGGRLASGVPTDAVEVYDPVADAWDTRAPLPAALSGYALASFEGRLYVFGGWNGSDYVASVYEYDPAADAWVERTRMPTARGFAAAAVSGGKLYVVGGTDSKGPTRTIEAYVPARDSEIANPWQSLPQAPASLSVIAATTIADTLYVAGSADPEGQFAAWEFRPELDSWQPLDLSTVPAFSSDWFSVVALHTHLYVLGSPPVGDAPAQFVAYQALYTHLIPIITGGQPE